MPFGAVNVNVRVTPVWPAVTLPGLTVMVPAPSLACVASVNVVCARIPDFPPVAVTMNRTLMSCTSGENWLFVHFPLLSATAVSAGWVSSSGSSTSSTVTVSPGVHPWPLMMTVSPGA